MQTELCNWQKFYYTTVIQRHVLIICHIISKHRLSFVVVLMLSFRFPISLLFISNVTCIIVCCGVSYKLINEYEWMNEYFQAPALIPTDADWSQWWKASDLHFSGGIRNFHLGAITQKVWGQKYPSGVLGWEWDPGRCLKSKQFADIVYRFWLHKRSQFEDFAHFASWFLTSMFYAGRGLNDILGA